MALLWLNLLVGRIVFIGILLGWLFWGRKKFKAHLDIHLSAFGLIFLLGAALALGHYGFINTWLILGGHHSADNPFNYVGLLI